jgi:hypothetical protein
MERTLACTRCGELVSSLLDQVLDLPAFTICQCRCAEVVVIGRPRRVLSTPQFAALSP